jgi:hypothetical protein
MMLELSNVCQIRVENHILLRLLEGPTKISMP